MQANAGQAAESSSSDGSESEMSFTSGDDGHDEKVLQDLIKKKDISSIKESNKSKSKPASQKKVEVKFDSKENGDLQKFNTKTKKFIQSDKELDGQADLEDAKKNVLKSLFVTEDDNAVMEQFEKEKDNEIENELGATVQVAEVKRGWNDWAGTGI